MTDASPPDRRKRLSYLQSTKGRGEPWPILTSYDHNTVGVSRALATLVGFLKDGGCLAIHREGQQHTFSLEAQL